METTLGSGNCQANQSCAPETEPPPRPSSGSLGYQSPNARSLGERPERPEWSKPSQADSIRRDHANTARTEAEAVDFQRSSQFDIEIRIVARRRGAETTGLINRVIERFMSPSHHPLYLLLDSEILCADHRAVLQEPPEARGPVLPTHALDSLRECAARPTTARTSAILVEVRSVGCLRKGLEHALVSMLVLAGIDQ